jgi:hypothetical protein
MTKRLETLVARKAKLERELAEVRLMIAALRQKQREIKTKSQFVTGLTTRAQNTIGNALQSRGIDRRSMVPPSEHPDAVATILHYGIFGLRKAHNVGNVTIAELENWLNSKGASLYKPVRRSADDIRACAQD